MQAGLDVGAAGPGPLPSAKGTKTRAHSGIAGTAPQWVGSHRCHDEVVTQIRQCAGARENQRCEAKPSYKCHLRGGRGVHAERSGCCTVPCCSLAAPFPGPHFRRSALTSALTSCHSPAVHVTRGSSSDPRANAPWADLQGGRGGTESGCAAGP